VREVAANESGAVRQPLLSLQVGRGLAALAVLLCHATVTVGAPKYWGREVADGAFAAGAAGVEYFFVLSGFIIFWVHANDIGKPRRFGHYLFRRFARIYPIYWLVLAVAVFGFSLFRGFGSGPETLPTTLLGSAFLVGPNTAPTIGVSWTLFHEVLFYGLFGLVVLSRRAGLLAFAVWFVVCAMDAPLGYAVSHLNLLFLIGVVTAVLVRRWPVPRPLVLTTLGAASLVAVALLKWNHTLRYYPADLLLGLSSALVIAGGVEIDRSRAWRAPWFFVVLGDASYVLYLTHTMVDSIAAKALLWLPYWAGFLALAAVSVGVGMAAHSAVERPLLNALSVRAVKWREMRDRAQTSASSSV
jgi:peptidoglycan/LPS O-acetylase OafA/YrhL